MITSPTGSFYLIKAEGEAAEVLTAAISPSSMTDIQNVVLVSGEFDSDIQAINEMDSTVDAISSQLSSSKLEENVKLNPLYLPFGMDEVDKVIELDRIDSARFNGMDGSPYTIKMTVLKCRDDDVITAKVAYMPFEFPSYTEILRGQESVRIN